MRLKVINSNSSGNCYILENDSEALIIECGVRFERIQQALNYDLRKVVGCIITHNHLDHCKAVKDVMKAGIGVFASDGTHEAMGTSLQHRRRRLNSGHEEWIGNFRVKAFNIQHDCPDPVGFLIHHRETGNILFLTDTYYCEYTFRNLNNVIIEANYCETILDQRLSEGLNPKFLRDRVITSHMSLATTKKTLQAYDLKAVNNIVLIHLSDSNSDARRFKREVQEQTGKAVHVAEAGLVIENFNKEPF